MKYFIVFLIFSLFSFVKSQTCFGRTAASGNACSRHGNCISADTCDCDNGYVGDRCAFRGCLGVRMNSKDPLVCGGHGTCLENGECYCDDGWIGDNCTQFTCNGFIPDHVDSINGACSGRGTCVGPNNCACTSNYLVEAGVVTTTIIGYFGQNCEYFDCQDNLCKSLINEERIVSEQYYYNLESYAPHIFFTYTLYSIYPYRRPNETVDCKYVFDSDSLKLLGTNPRCMWKSHNTHEFIVYLGEAYLLTDENSLKINLFPFEEINGADAYYASMKSYEQVITVVQEFWNGLMSPIPSYFKSPIYQVVGFLANYWIWVLVGGGIFLFLSFGSSFFSFFFCCDPRKIRQTKNVKKVREVNRKILARRAEREKQQCKPRRVGIVASHVANPFTASFRGSIEPRTGNKSNKSHRRTRSQDYGYYDTQYDWN